VVAGYAEHVNVQVSRNVDEVEKLDSGDNTIIFSIRGGNDSSSNGQNDIILTKEEQS
jgi:hypothetical protein